MTNDITLLEVLKNFWAARFYILISMVVTLICAVIFVIVVTPHYKATMIVAPADGYALGDYASAAQYDQIAALPFWRPKDKEGASTDFYRFMNTLRGVSVAQILMKDQTVIQKINETQSNDINSPEALADYLNRHIRVDPLGATPLRRVRYHHPAPDFSKALLRKLHLIADQMIRRDRREQSQSRIAYLSRTLETARNPDHRKMITNLLMQQEYVQMLANLDEDYAAIIVEPPNTSPKPVYPNKTLLFSVAIFLGLFLGYLIWVVRHTAQPPPQ